MTDDARELNTVGVSGDEEAFRQFVLRHPDLVYATALRQVNGDAYLAKGVAQTVFHRFGTQIAGTGEPKVIPPIDCYDSSGVRARGFLALCLGS
jgi:hypothetical protein